MGDLLSFTGKRARAKRANERARDLHRRGQTKEAIREYERAIHLDPEWSVPAYNLGLMYKYSGDWELSLQHNLRAAKLAPEDQAGWWNLGIAATALRRWDVARIAWRGAGIAVPEGDGPIDYSCGTAPIRLNPETDGEVVWSERLDPARAIVRNIPLPESGFRFGDVVLNDGAATGHRRLNDREVPVFNCLGLFDASRFSTWVVELEFAAAAGADAGAVEVLKEMATKRDLASEDWSTSIRTLCKACSEGSPSEEHEHPHTHADRRHQIAIAAPDSEQGRRLVDDWIERTNGVTILAFDLALNAAV